jgi:hypothetical protein
VESKLVTATYDGGYGLVLFVTLKVTITHFFLILLEFDMASLNCCGIFTAISYIYIYELIEATELWMLCMGSLQGQ